MNSELSSHPGTYREEMLKRNSYGPIPMEITTHLNSWDNTTLRQSDREGITEACPAHSVKTNSMQIRISKWARVDPLHVRISSFANGPSRGRSRLSDCVGHLSLFSSSMFRCGVCVTERIFPLHNGLTIDATRKSHQFFLVFQLPPMELITHTSGNGTAESALPKAVAEFS